MSGNDGPSEGHIRGVAKLYAALAGDATFARVRCLLEFDWSRVDVTIEDLGLDRLMRTEAIKLRAALDDGSDTAELSDIADAIRYTERHDALAQDALWWLGRIAFDPALGDLRCQR